jgi:hypothetical protein
VLPGQDPQRRAGWLYLDLAHLLGSASAAIVTAVIGHGGWQLLGLVLH